MLGIVHIVIGLIAISVATGGGGEADQGGAMEQIQKTPLGVVLLWIIVVGLARPGDLADRRDLPRARPRHEEEVGPPRQVRRHCGRLHRDRRHGARVRARRAVRFVASRRNRSARKLLATPGGVFLLVLIGLIVGAVGIAFIVRGFTRAFEKHLALPSGVARKGIVTFGVVGYVAKGIAVAVTGILFVVAALTHDPETAGGLDAALHALAALPFGAVILWVVGAGLVIYGVFCFARARYAKM